MPDRFRAREIVTFDRAISHGASRLYLALDEYAREKGECWPSNRTLCERLGCSERSLRYWLGGLLEAGYITRRPRCPGGPNVFQLFHLPGFVPETLSTATVDNVVEKEGGAAEFVRGGGRICQGGRQKSVDPILLGNQGIEPRNEPEAESYPQLPACGPPRQSVAASIWLKFSCGVVQSAASADFHCWWCNAPHDPEHGWPISNGIEFVQDTIWGYVQSWRIAGFREPPDESICEQVLEAIGHDLEQFQRQMRAIDGNRKKRPRDSYGWFPIILRAPPRRAALRRSA